MENITECRYKGRQIYVMESIHFKEKYGVRVYQKNNPDLIIINKDLSSHRKRIELHRLFTGRGLRKKTLNN